MDPTQPSVLVAAFPRRHLASAAETLRANGRVVLPAGSPGDLDAATPGTPVLLMISGPDEVPAATWRATFVRRVEPRTGQIPRLTPPTWVREHGSRTVARIAPDESSGEDEDDEAAGPQSYFEVEGLEELPRQAWIFANEFVGKQERGGRAFFPRAPRLTRIPG